MASLFDDEENVVPIIQHNVNSTTSGAFFIKDGEIVSDIRLEFNPKHPMYSQYLKRLKDLLRECEERHILKSSSGI